MESLRLTVCAALLSALSVGCGDDGNGDPDGGLDGGADAATDAAVDAPADAGVDAALPIAPPLADHVDETGIGAHLDALYAAAVDHGGTREHGTAGYRAGVDYAVSVLEAAGFTVDERSITVGEPALETWNVVATRAGPGSRIVMVGAHLDSVPEGPGMNDDASGVAAVLGLADAVAAAEWTPPSTVRLAIWGAEEPGILGSEEHVLNGMTPEERVETLYINLDMVGNPGGLPVVSMGPVGEVPDGSDEVGLALIEGFLVQGVTPVRHLLSAAVMPVAYPPTDVASFITHDVRAANVNDGGPDLDPCNHAACDDRGNVDAATVALHARAVAHAVQLLSGERPDVEIPPPPDNRLFSHEPGTCYFPFGSFAPWNPLAVLEGMEVMPGGSATTRVASPTEPIRVEGLRYAAYQEAPGAAQGCLLPETHSIHLLVTDVWLPGGSPPDSFDGARVIDVPTPAGAGPFVEFAVTVEPPIDLSPGQHLWATWVSGPLPPPTGAEPITWMCLQYCEEEDLLRSRTFYGSTIGQRETSTRIDVDYTPL